MNRRWFVAAIAVALVASVRAQHLEHTIRLPAPVGIPEGRPSMARNPGLGLLYIAGDESESLQVIDERTSAVTAALEVDGTIDALCFNPLNNRLYCADAVGGVLHVLDGTTGLFLDDVELDDSPVALLLDSTDNKLYCLCEEGCIDVVDCRGDTLVAVIAALGDVAGLYPMCYVAALGRAYATSTLNDTVVAIDCRMDTVVARIPETENPLALCYNTVNGLLYLSSEGAALRVIDPLTNQVIDSVPGAGKARWLVHNPVQNKLYCGAAGGVWVVECSGNTLLARLPVDSVVDAIAWSPRGDRLLVSTHGWWRDPAILVFDGAQDTLVAEWWGIGGGVGLYAPDVDRLYMMMPGEVLVGFDCGTGNVVALLLDYFGTWASCVEPRSGKTYCIDDYLGLITVVDPAAGSVTANLYDGPIWGDFPVALAACPSLGRVYVATERGRVLSLDAEADTVRARVDVGARLRKLAIDVVAQKLYCATGDSAMVIIDCRSDSLGATLSLGGAIADVCADVSRGVCYAAIPGAVIAVDASGDTIKAAIPAGLGPAALVIATAQNRLYCADSTDSCLYVVNTSLNELAARVDVPGRPVEMCLDSLDNKLYVACSENDTAYVVDCGALAVVGRIPRAVSKRSPALGYFAGSNSVYSVAGDSLVVIDCVQDRRVAAIGGISGDCVPPVFLPEQDLICAGEKGGGTMLVIHDDRQPRWAATAATPSVRTVVRGRYFLRGHDLGSLYELSGRRVAHLHPGANDVSGLAPGVYFVRTARTQAQAQTVRKIVILN